MTDVANLHRVQWLTALTLVGTFALGTLTGAGIARWGAPEHPRPWHHGSPPPPPPPGPPLGPWLIDDLSLSGGQRPAAEALFERHRAALDAILRESFPRVRELNGEIERELRLILNPDQAKKLDQLLVERRPPFPPPGGEHGGPPFPPPGGERRPPF
ncbi:MAG TPA: hypothetical protein VNN80_35810, partial [Polyangiaceae bacterium]|nr:hypothetical protein [Polyangiaceae bacterium]